MGTKIEIVELGDHLLNVLFRVDPGLFGDFYVDNLVNLARVIVVVAVVRTTELELTDFFGEEEIV